MIWGFLRNYSTYKKVLYHLEIRILSAKFCVISDPNELELWEKSIQKMIEHFVNKYGLAQVRKWNFESWNEPDHKIHHNFNEENYRNYLNATWYAVKKFKFGGPAGSCKAPHFLKMCKTFLEFAQDHEMDFISFHR